MLFLSEARGVEGEGVEGEGAASRVTFSRIYRVTGWRCPEPDERRLESKRALTTNFAGGRQWTLVPRLASSQFT